MTKNKSDKDLSKLDESFADLQLDDSFIATSSSRQNPKIVASTQQDVQAKVRDQWVHHGKKSSKKLNHW